MHNIAFQRTRKSGAPLKAGVSSGEIVTSRERMSDEQILGRANPISVWPGIESAPLP